MLTRLKWKAESDAFPDKKLERRYMIAGAPRPYPFGLVAETSSCAKPPAVRPSSVEAGPAAAAPVSAVSSLRLVPLPSLERSLSRNIAFTFRNKQDESKRG